MPRSLAGRLIASALIFIALAILATGFAVQVSLHRFVRGQIDQRLDTEILTLRSSFEPGVDGRLVPARGVEAPPFDDPRTGWIWLARSGATTWMSPGLHRNAPLVAVWPAGPHPEAVMARMPDGSLIRARAQQIVVDGQPLELLAAAPPRAEVGPLRDALAPVVVALLLLGAGLVAATLLQVRLGLRPLARLRADLSAVRTGRRERLPARQPVEVRPLAHEVNELLDQHAANLERARRHVANLAHALKTPLAALALSLEDPARDPDHALRGLTLAMDRRIRHHLSRARTAALGPAARMRLPLAARVADHVAAFTKIHAERGITCLAEIEAGLTVACDGQDLDELVGNLLDNAFKWARSTITITAATAGRRVVLRIADDGPGIPNEAVATVLKPGKRLDEETPGDGFGLAIVQELAELYGGGLTLGRSAAGGLLATLDLPGAAEAPGSDQG
ncbi:HAMP domain-containing sensor histidine kinase [Lichenihabitans sp. Uapishka_5]|uniref:sensor histidine kinase n=1 Tax=Lichenihabitans sp. Uapishka_5 TaxID=3037302 RepID=UPI0029E7CC0A|nr:HAMP domain-containing sensor histidine kinase [Lichenihabitans sp. Uapishka_5]MDX7952520.1 HAMP domain-containing sensor histidine kinase [Lichenihabitans sp. Uapishka_5]